MPPWLVLAGLHGWYATTILVFFSFDCRRTHAHLPNPEASAPVLDTCTDSRPRAVIAVPPHWSLLVFSVVLCAATPLERFSGRNRLWKRLSSSVTNRQSARVSHPATQSTSYFRRRVFIFSVFLVLAKIPNPFQFSNISLKQSVGFVTGMCPYFRFAVSVWDWFLIDSLARRRLCRSERECPRLFFVLRLVRLASRLTCSISSPVVGRSPFLYLLAPR